MNPVPMGVMLAIIIMAFFIGGVTGCSGRDMQAKAEAAKALAEASKKTTKLQEELNKVSTEYEDFKSNSSGQREIRTNTIKEIYRDVEVDPGCAPVAAAVSVLDSAIASANSAASGEPRK